ncbi:hypothetical protein H6P81_019899 [Aristolochia fimbriata]|uniref:26S proteasome non-ATPase regulatory subunit 10 n=1 Tax=Aristolochia fimbriata TaxID=158543 RepID=A0AAV7DUU3_ARIFI|nr:hypothetical protein H6P81_019899 [Aristolochia fimbriata]
MEIDAAAPSGSTHGLKDEDLFRAAERGDLSVFQSLSEEELLRVQSLRNEDGRSLLHVAVALGHTNVLSILSTVASACVNSVDEEGWAPLHSAASRGDVAAIEALLSFGGNVNLANHGGRTALHYAASKGWLQVAELLLSHGAKINHKDKVGSTPLHRAASVGHAQLCELLIEEGAEVDAVDRAGQTPLMSAVICHNKEVALLLIRHGADVDAEDKEGYTVLGRAPDDMRLALVDAAKAMCDG